MPSKASSTEVSASTTAASSPPEIKGEGFLDEDIIDEDRKARLQNRQSHAEAAKKKQAARKKKGRRPSEYKKGEQAKQLDELLAQTAAFSNVLASKTQVLGRVGSGLDDKALGQHNLEMAKQPSIMSGGTMRDYQLEGLTWMFEICQQGMSGILADEMGLGKTIQTISLIALLREQYGYLGPHLIVVPMSTLSNWMEEFAKWTPSIPVVQYHGTPTHRADVFQNHVMKHYVHSKPTKKFPVVVTTYDILLRDEKQLSKINWELIIIDEGHRLKNFDSKLYQQLRGFTSASRLLITGTPLQNNLKELWSLLHFLLPNIFTSWESFEEWFDFDDLQDEAGTEEFIADKRNHDLIKKIHLVLQPLLLRRIKADVEHLLPKKREYVLYAPMTKEQRELYEIMSDKDADARGFMEQKVVERLNASNAFNTSAKTSRSSKAEESNESSDENGGRLMKAALRNSTKRATKSAASTSPRGNAFDTLMGRGKTSAGKISKSGKRKASDAPQSKTPPSKSAKTSRQSSPATSIRSTRSGRKTRMTYVEVEPSDEDELSDDEFEKLVELENVKLSDEDEELDPEEARRVQTLEMAKREISVKKLGNPLMQLRLVCNSPHNFYNPWSTNANQEVDETLITQSGKMLMLDRLLPSLFERGHKVLIFSQFKTQLNIIEDYARELRDWLVCRIDGSVAQEDRRQAIKDFNEDPEHKLFLLATRAGGQGINLASADTVILFDSDWNPQQDLQAIDRAHRIGQKRPVVVIRLATKGTVEEGLLMSADAKRRLEKLVIKKGGFKTLADQMGSTEDVSEQELRALLAKEGKVFEYTGKEEILSDADLDLLCDRSDEAYTRAATGQGNSKGFKIVETKAAGLMSLGAQ